MKRTRLLTICVIGLCTLTARPTRFVQEQYSDEAAYLKARQRLIEAERSLCFDRGITLTAPEEEANRRLMACKRQEIERTRGHFPPAQSFLKSKTKTLINENLYDAILLGAKRIGHGLALIKHPLLMQIVRERQIAIEVCPISNQVLGCVSDLRNHPAVHYINSGLPVVLSPDDPGIMRHVFS